MESSERQGSATQVAAWLGVVAIHAGLFWLLANQGGTLQESSVGERLRLVFVQPAKRAAMHPTSPTRARPASAPHVPDRPQAIGDASSTAQAVTPQPLPSTPVGTLVDQARRQARDQTPLVFASNPLDDRRARLPGGERPGLFRMKEPVSAAKVLERIGEAFGNRPVCPDIQSRIAGLLTATSNHERELLTEALRRDREYCQP